MIFEIPSHYFVCAGCADSFSQLNAFDEALMAAGVGDVNLVRLSSILPPGCQQVEPFRPPGGALVPAAYARMTSSNPGEVIASAVAIAVPEDPSLPGLIMEHHAAASLDEVRTQVHEMAEAGMHRRERTIAEVICRGIEHRVERHGATFAGVILWNGPGGTT